MSTLTPVTLIFIFTYVVSSSILVTLASGLPSLLTLANSSFCASIFLANLCSISISSLAISSQRFVKLLFVQS